MKFFIPGANDENEAEEVYSAIKKNVQNTLNRKITDRRIFSIKYRHNNSELYAEVGKKFSLNDDEVTAILESEPYLICTPLSGEWKGLPIMASSDTIISIVDFDK